MKFIIKTFGGLEEVLAEELKALGAKDVEIGKRAVFCCGEKEDVFKFNYLLRTGVKVLISIAEFKITGKEDLYAGAKKIEWNQFLTQHDHFCIDSVLNSDIFNHSNYPSLVLKDAIADYFKEKYYKRPNINTDQPTARFNIHISQDQANIAFDTTGDGLFKRGYRDKMNEAPINEVIAAGLIKLSDWDKKTDFLDPMCGAGTVLIEAAMDLLDIPSGYWREHWAFMNANDFKMKEWEAFKAQYKWEAKSKVKIYGRDLSARTVKLIANPNVNRTGLSDVIKLSKQDFFKSEEQDREYHICSNPPYDERLKLEDGIKFYEEIGTTLKFKYKGSKAAIVSNHEEGMKRIGLKADHKYEIQNVNLKFKVNTYSVSK